MSNSGTNIATTFGIKRSPEWEKVEKDMLKKNIKCAACNTTKGLQVHHIFPFHYCIALGRPDLELDERNLIVLCETEVNEIGNNHHLLLGHLGNFKEGNLLVKEDVNKYFGKTLNEIKESQEWNNEEKNGRLKALDLMTQEEKDNLRAEMDRAFPKNK